MGTGGLDGVRGYETGSASVNFADAAVTNLEPGITHSTEVTCPTPTKRVIGGGVLVNNTLNTFRVVVTSSYPSDSTNNNKWTGQVQNVGTVAASSGIYTVYVECAEAS